MKTIQIPVKEYIDLLDIKLSANIALKNISNPYIGGKEFIEKIDIENAAIKDKIKELKSLL